MDAAEANLKAAELLNKLSGLRIVKGTEEKITVELTPTINGVRDTYNRRYYIKYRRVSENAYSIGQYRMPPGFFPDKDVSSYVKESTNNLLTKDQVGVFTRRMRYICYCAAVRDSQFQQIMTPSTILPHLHKSVTVTSSKTVKFEIVHTDKGGVYVPVCYTLHYNWEEVRPNYVETSSEYMSREKLKILSDRFSSVMRDYPLLTAIEHLVTGSTTSISESTTDVSVEQHISDSVNSRNGSSQVSIEQQITDYTSNRKKVSQVSKNMKISHPDRFENDQGKASEVGLYIDQQVPDSTSPASSTNPRSTSDISENQYMSDSLISTNSTPQTLK